MSNIANEFFSIRGETFNNDSSFLSTMRALLHKRCNGSEIFFGYRNFNTAGASTTQLGPKQVFDAIWSVPFGENYLQVCNLTGTAEDNAATFTLYDDPERGFTAQYPDFVEAKDLQLFVKNRGKLNARFYISENYKETLVICEDLSIPTYHLLQSLTPRLFPQFFVNSPLDNEELALLDSLTYRTATEYERLIAILAGRIDFRSHLIKTIIGDFEKSGRREEIRRTKEQIDNYRCELEQLEGRYAQYIANLDELNIKLSGQELALESASDGSELIDYFTCNRNIMPVSVFGRSMRFTVKTFFGSFDPEMYSTYLSNHQSCLFTGYEYLPAFKKIDDRRRMIEAIFADDPAMKVKMCSNYTIDLRGNCSTTRGYNYGNDFVDYVPNPHIHYYACLGNYQRYINSALRSGNVVGAIEQCIASAKSLNLCEPHTTRYFLSGVFNNTNKIIRLNDGRDVTPEEALEYLKSLDEKKEEANV